MRGFRTTPVYYRRSPLFEMILIRRQPDRLGWTTLMWTDAACLLIPKMLLPGVIRPASAGRANQGSAILLASLPADRLTHMPRTTGQTALPV
jgi:hypothetical protein